MEAREACRNSLVIIYNINIFSRVGSIAPTHVNFDDLNSGFL